MKKLSQFFNNFFSWVDAAQQRVLFKSGQAGFTMIELLVVIAVIGVLAVAVLSSINPIEQINKGRDTRLRSNAAQLINAMDRYYAIQEEYTWNSVGDGTNVVATTTETFPDGTVCVATTAGAGSGDFCLIGGTGYTMDTDGWIQELADTEEVKQSFIDQLAETSTTNKLYVAKPADEDLSVCFEPSSNQFKLEALKACETRQGSMPTGVCDSGTTYTAPFDVSTWANELICIP